jgi:hypothetical protein
VESLFALLGILLVLGLFNVALRAGVGTLRAVARTAMGQGSLTDNFQAAVIGMRPLEARLLDTKLSNEKDALSVKEVQVKGLLPINRAYRLAFVTSLFDKTSGELEPVICPLETFQEPHTFAFQHLCEIGSLEPGNGLVSFARVGAIIPDLIQTPHSGKRQLFAILRLIDMDNRPDITQGFHQKEHSGLIWQQSLSFEYIVVAKGYLEAAELRDKARLVCVRLAMAIAMWDGSLGDGEGAVIKKWVQKILADRSGERRERLKTEFNSSMKDAYEKGRHGDLTLTTLTEELNAMEDSPSKYEAIELCFDVLAASAGESSDKARLIDLVGRALNLDSHEIERIRDIRIVGVAGELSKQVRIEDLLGIDQSWGPEQIKRHLRSEFQKWNNRLTSLPEGEERNNAQRMLDAISEARKKYG